MTEKYSSMNCSPTFPVVALMANLSITPTSFPNQFHYLPSPFTEMRFIFLICILFLIKQHSSPGNRSKEKADIYVLPNQKQIDKLLNHSLRTSASTADFQRGFHPSSRSPGSGCQAPFYSIGGLTVPKGKRILILPNKLDFSHFKMKTQPPLKL